MEISTGKCVKCVCLFLNAETNVNTIQGVDDPLVSTQTVSDVMATLEQDNAIGKEAISGAMATSKDEGERVRMDVDWTNEHDMPPLVRYTKRGPALIDGAVIELPDTP